MVTLDELVCLILVPIDTYKGVSLCLLYSNPCIFSMIFGMFAMI